MEIESLGIKGSIATKLSFESPDSAALYRPFSFKPTHFHRQVSSVNFCRLFSSKRLGASSTPCSRCLGIDFTTSSLITVCSCSLTCTIWPPYQKFAIRNICLLNARFGSASSIGLQARPYCLWPPFIRRLSADL